MLPKFGHLHYSTFLNQLVSFQNYLNSNKIEENLAKKHFEEAKNYFCFKILPLHLEDNDFHQMQQWQSWQTELHRTLRLLETDLLFWQSSRQPTTRQSRLQIICDRLDTLIRYCQEILNLGKDTSC